ncbi:hypothetical protein BaRGS_00034723 [Batillaria attramentaria]|uniref:Secreted protein n=1 Tax=Batillaria attramentaria TaxID=370345 RepID=A0ABD0JGP6_9CAEN
MRLRSCRLFPALSSTLWLGPVYTPSCFSWSSLHGLLIVSHHAGTCWHCTVFSLPCAVYYSFVVLVVFVARVAAEVYTSCAGQCFK